MRMLAWVPGPGSERVAARLGALAGPEDGLAERVDDLAVAWYHVERLVRAGVLCRVLLRDGVPVATAHGPLAGPRPVGPPVLCRFAILRRQGDEWVIESPRTSSRVVLPDLAGFSANWPPLLDLLGEAGLLQSEESPALRQWEPHDLLFHARSRLGRHRAPYGATFRFQGEIPPQPAVRPRPEGDVVPLGRRHAVPADLWQTLQARRSTRRFGDEPLSQADLGEFLFRTSHVEAVVRAEPYDVSRRPYPSGGAAYDLEVWLAVQRCTGLEPGLYHYEPVAHELTRVGAAPPELFTDAVTATGLEGPPQVLVLLASRFQRLSWKYSSMAYATTLKNAGVLLQTMYLAATALGLGACALGGGDSDRFARAAGTDYYAETTVAELLLGSLP